MSEIEKAAEAFVRIENPELEVKDYCADDLMDAFKAGAAWQHRRAPQELELLRRVAAIAYRSVWNEAELNKAFKGWREFLEKTK